MLYERQATQALNTKPGQPIPPKPTRSSLKEIEKRRILENFVENDEALGQLLDFISSHYIQSSEGAEQRDLYSTLPSGVGATHNYTATNSVSTLTSQPSHPKMQQQYLS